ncbi:MAG: hypothetical protein JWO08_1179 [Verrucomicrobiaceae bacterium]|nr:hypothetical protein [Verrucomicrobiaceae bacterium]
MTHTYIDPLNSVFRFGMIEAEVEFYGDVHRADSADIQDWSFLLNHPIHGPIDITADMEALDAAMTDAGLADVFRSLHCRRAAKDRRMAGIPATGAG